MRDGASARRPVQIIDSHTAGEPTRVVIAGGPSLGNGNLQSQLEVFRSRHDSFRTAVLSEPRGSDVLVGALLCAPHDPQAATGVIFFNDVGYLGMCGHGSIGVITTLAHMGRVAAGTAGACAKAGAASKPTARLATMRAAIFMVTPDGCLVLRRGRRRVGIYRSHAHHFTRGQDVVLHRARQPVIGQGGIGREGGVVIPQKTG